MRLNPVDTYQLALDQGVAEVEREVQHIAQQDRAGEERIVILDIEDETGPDD